MILHFGAHKTGSTSIQRYLFRALKDPRFHYVRSLGENPSLDLLLAFDGRSDAHPRFRARGQQPETLAMMGRDIRTRLADELRTARARGAVPILSGEEITRLRGNDLGEFLGFLEREAGPVQAVGYMRPPVGTLESRFQQELREQLTRPQLSTEWYDFRPFLEGLLQHLGRDRVELWPFDLRLLHHGCVVQDFCHRLGMVCHPGDIVPVNESLSRDALSLLYLHYTHQSRTPPDAAWEAETHLMSPKLRSLAGPRLHFHSSMTAAWVETTRPQREWMERTFGISLQEDPTAHDSGAIRSIDELGVVSPQAAEWLDARTGTADRSQGVPTYTPEAAACALAAFRIQVAARHRARQAETDTPVWRRWWMRAKSRGLRLFRTNPPQAA